MTSARSRWAGWSWLALAVGCAVNDPAAPNTLVGGEGAVATGGGERAVAEADIIQLDGGLLYAMSSTGTLSAVDVSTPGRLTLLGQVALAGEPFELYPRGDFLIALSKQAGASLVTVLEAHHGAHPVSLGTFEVPGQLADSRIVGDVLYLVTYQDSGCGNCPTRTTVSSFDLGQPRSVRPVDRVSVQADMPGGSDPLWESRGKRSMLVADGRLYIGGQVDQSQDALARGSAGEGIIDVLDVSDPHGQLRGGARLVVAGAILSRWQLDDRGGILRVISQRGAGRNSRGEAPPELQTFRVDSAQSFVPLARVSVRLPGQEGLRAVRFTESRAYAITYVQRDPLLVFDLSDPARPVQRGELLMPGFLFHLEPRGNRLLGLGVDREDPRGSLNVSLIDVRDADAPALLQRVAFAPNVGHDPTIVNLELPEDQDRLGKAFQVFADGLIAVPFRDYRGAQANRCADAGGGVQLMSLSRDRLMKGALLPLPGHPRRAFENGTEIVAISDSHVRSFSRAPAEPVAPTAQVTIGACEVVPVVMTPGQSGLDRYGLPACAAAPGQTGASLPVVIILMAVAGASLLRRGRGRNR